MATKTFFQALATTSSKVIEGLGTVLLFIVANAPETEEETQNPYHDAVQKDFEVRMLRGDYN